MLTKVLEPMENVGGLTESDYALQLFLEKYADQHAYEKSPTERVRTYPDDSDVLVDGVKDLEAEEEEAAEDAATSGA